MTSLRYGQLTCVALAANLGMRASGAMGSMHRVSAGVRRSRALFEKTEERQTLACRRRA